MTLDELLNALFPAGLKAAAIARRVVQEAAAIARRRP
jgi:hypothetical protein